MVWPVPRASAALAVAQAVLSEGTKSELCVANITLMLRAQVKGMLMLCQSSIPRRSV